MYQRMIDWGYYATVEACRKWLDTYRLVSGGIDGNASVYTLSRQDLQRWYYVDQLTPTQLQHKYLMEHGVYSNRAAFGRFLLKLLCTARSPFRLTYRCVSIALQQMHTEVQ